MRAGPPSSLLLLVASLLCLVCGAATASPLPATADTAGLSAAPVWAPLTPEDLLRSDPKLDARADAFLVGTPASMPQAIRQPAEWDFQNGHNERSARLTGPGLVDQLRYLVNVESGSGATPTQARGGNRGARAAPAAFAGIDMGEAADQWLRDTVQSLVDSTLRLEVNERGRASFSVLGLGDFAFSVSADRSQIALTEGNEALFIVDRPLAAGNGRDSASSSLYGPLPGGRHGSEQPAIKAMMELVTDVASHPISLLLYCVVAAYLVLWSVLSRQRNKSFAPAPRFVSVPAASVAQERSVPRQRSRRRRHTRHSRRSSA
ncbi:MAG: hypothetical protein ACREUX_08270 [Burkholderiales bacterium]